MPQTKNLCAQIDLDLHRKISEAREQTGQTTSQYITDLLTEYFKIKESGGNEIMANGKSRTLAFQIDEEFFLRIKTHLERETARTGHKLTQREFVLGLIEKALDEAERQAQETAPQAEKQQGDTVLTGGAEDTTITQEEQALEYPGADFNG